jgi:hypothetical protein
MTGRLLGPLIAALFVSWPALAQVSPLPSNQFMASPSGEPGYLSPRPQVLSDLPPIPSNAVLGNTTGVLVSPSALTLPSCSLTSSALSWANNVGFGCNSAINATQLGGFTWAAPGPMGPVTISGSSGTQPTITATNAGTAAAYTTPAFNFLETEGYASFGSGNTHFGLVLQAAKNAAGANSTGSRTGATFQQLGGGGTPTDYFTGLYGLASPTAGANNNSGNFTGVNGFAMCPSGMTPTSCVGGELDTTTNSTVTNIREGLRIADIGSTGAHATTTDAAVGIVSSGIGFNWGVLLADATTANFPIAAAGTIMGTTQTATVANIFDFHTVSCTGNEWASPGLTINCSGNPTVSGQAATNTGFGSPAALAQNWYAFAANSTTNPEIVGLFSVSSSTGAASPNNTNYRAALSAFASGSTGTASLWASDFACATTAGTGATVGCIGIEIDTNLAGGSFTAKPVTAIGPWVVNAIATGSGPNTTLAAYVAASPITSMWQNAFVVYDYTSSGSAVINAEYYGDSKSVSVMQNVGTHTTGIDFSTATFSGNAWASPNATISGAGVFSSGGTAGVTCTAGTMNIATMTTKGGITTHC